METFKKVALLVVMIAGVAGFAVVASQQTAAEDDKKAAEQSQNTEAKKDDSKETEAKAESSRYAYVAQPGDSYSELARKAVQTYGLVHGVKLSPAQIVAAETDLTVKAGSPELNEGENVTFDESAVKAAVEAASKLAGDEHAAWEAYVADVDFDTRDNGEARA